MLTGTKVVPGPSLVEWMIVLSIDPSQRWG